jgi:hypothetical protein
LSYDKLKDKIALKDNQVEGIEQDQQKEQSDKIIVG